MGDRRHFLHRTIDGQHRVLGVFIEKQRITDAISAIDRDLARQVKPEREAERERLIGQMNRLKAEYIGLDIYVEPNPIKAQQMFVDVADNAHMDDTLSQSPATARQTGHKPMAAPPAPSPMPNPAPNAPGFGRSFLDQAVRVCARRLHSGQFTRALGHRV